MTQKKISLSYTESRAIAYTGDDNARARIAERSDIKPEILYYLVDDESHQVRLNLAANQATPRLADVKLARDTEEEIKLELAVKIARLVPDLEPDEQDRVYQATVETLEILARDQATRVRQILAETLKDVANAPPSVIKHLARDTESIVAEPVLLCSPVLNDDDLLEIISASPLGGQLSAISRRDMVSELVSDAIVASSDITAIALLLGNNNAQIREETLDAVIDRAHEFTDWHLPLVERPKLPARAAVRLAKFVAGSLINMLHNRGDLDEKFIAEIISVVEQRVEEGSIDAGSVETEFRDPDRLSHPVPPEKEAIQDEPDENGKDDEPEEVDDLWLDQKVRKKPVISPLDVARSKMEEGKLDETSIVEALNRGDVDLVIAEISVLAELDMAQVEKAVDAKSAKAVMAVCWKAGLPARLSQDVQGKVAGLKDDQMLPATGHQYPLANNELKAELLALSVD